MIILRTKRPVDYIQVEYRLKTHKKVLKVKMKN